MINLYTEMNDKIADILRTDDNPAQQYAAAYIDDLWNENASLKSERDEYKKALEKLITAIKKEHRGDKPVPHSPALCWAVNQAKEALDHGRKEG